MTSASPVLELESFGACFGRRLVLDNVNLTLPAAGVDVLMGPVKAGKSTLMRSLAGLNEANALYRQWGTVTPKPASPGAPGGRMLVQQHAASLDAKIVDALVRHVRQVQGRSGLAWTELAEAALSEHGLKQVLPGIHQSVLTLPLHWQRAINILAHALAQPALLMVDEPTYGLEDQAALWLTGWLADLGRTQRLLVCLHHQGLARRLASRVVLLAGGRVLAHQPVEAFFTKPANAHVEHFVRTGSLAIAAPDAQPGHLGADVEAPPPLSMSARLALSEFDERPATPVAKLANLNDPAFVPTQPSALDGIPQKTAREAWPVKPLLASRPSRPADEDGDWAATVPAALMDVPRPASPRVRAGLRPEPPQPAKARTALSALVAQQRPSLGNVLPPVSRQGVENAAQAGHGVNTGRRGPLGFNWIVANKLAGCPEPGLTTSIDYDLELLLAVGITHLITLTEYDLPREALARHGLTNLHLPINDHEAPSLRQMYMLVRRMQALLDAGAVVAVHCKAGMGRTGTVLAAWLIREGGLGATAAIQRLRRIMSTYVQSAVQEKFLHDFEQDILARQ